MLGFLLGCVVGLIVGWNFLPQPTWLKEKIKGFTKQ